MVAAEIVPGPSIQGRAGLERALSAGIGVNHHPMSTRIRSLPISIEKLLGPESASPRISSSPEAIVATTVGAHHDPV